jgi:hypothetical protein
MIPHPQNENAAAACINNITGLGKISELNSIVATNWSDKTVPFVSKQLRDKMIWQASFRSISLASLATNADQGDLYKWQREFTAFINQETGQFIGIKCKFFGKADDSMRPEPSADSAEAQLRGAEELYSGVPDAYPNISFIEALKGLIDQGVGNPLIAKEIDAWYVLDSHLGSTPRAVWAITLRGIPPVTPRGGEKDQEVPEWQRNHIRYVVDAATGKCLFRTNVPQPTE